jgi:hypothetical protein
MTTYNRTITLASTADTITQNFSTDDSVVVTVNAAQYSAGATASITIQSGESGDVAVSSSTVSIGSSFTITGISAGTYKIYLFYYDKYYGTQQGWVQGNVTQGEILPASPTANNQTVPSTTTSVTVPISGGIAIEEAYSLCVTPGLTTNVQVVNDRIDAMTPYNGVGDIFTISSGEMPAIGSSRTYYIYSYRYTAYGGAGQYYYASSFTVTRQSPAPDTTPDQFTFTDVSNVALFTTQTSNLITISGINASTSVSVSGGTYSKNGGGYTSSAGTAVNGDTFRVRHTSSFNFSTSINTTLNVGGVTDTFTSTTLAADTTPNQFTFTDVTNVARSTTQTSNLITISGLNTSTSVSVSGGTYSKNGGGYTSSSGTAVNGDTFRVRHTSSASFSTAVNTTLTVGGVSDTFTSTTEADNIPDAFTFTDVTNAALNTLYTSNSITVSGIATSTSVIVYGVAGSVYSKNGGAFTSSVGSAVNGDTFRVRHTSAGSFSTSRTTTLSIGGSTGNFTTTTLAADTTPNQFTFTDVTNVAVSSTQVSNSITISGINTSTSVFVSGGAYSKNGGAFTTASGTALNGDTFRVLHTSSASFSTAVSTTLIVGGVSDTFTSTTIGQDTTPNQFTFTDVTNVARSTTQTSNTITISGINSTSSVSVSGGTYSKNGGAYTSSAGTAVNGDTFAVRHTSSASFSTAVNTTLNVGGVTDTFTSTTENDTVPNPFTFTDVTNVALSTTQTSNTITISGLNAATSVSISGGTYSKNGGAYTSSAGTAVNGDTFAVRHTSSASFSTAVNTTLNVGGVTDTFTSTTLASDTTPNQFTFTDVTNVAVSTTQTSNTITISGLNTSTSVSISGGTYSKNGGAYTSSAGTAVNGDTFAVRHTSSGSFSTAVSTTLNVGGVTDTFTSTTLGSDTAPDAFDLGGPVTDVGASVNIFSNIITVSGINTATSISISGTGSPAYSIDGGVTYTSSSGSVTGGTNVRVRVTSASTGSTSVTATLNIGGVTDTFTATTAGGGGGGSGIDSGPSNYGIEIRGPDGVTKVLSPTTRFGCALGEFVPITLTGNSSYLIVTDMTNLTTSNSTVLILSNVVTIVFSIAREINGFRITNDTNSTFSLLAAPIRF